MTRRPVHPVLARLALALLFGASALDLAGLAWDGGPWWTLSRSLLGTGLLTGLLAVIAGVAEILLRDIPGSALRWLLAHAAAMHVGLILFLVSFLLRREDPPAPAALVVGFAATALMIAGAVIGDRLVSRFRIGAPAVGVPQRAG